MAETYIRASTGEVVEIASYRTPEQAEAYKEEGGSVTLENLGVISEHFR